MCLLTYWSSKLRWHASLPQLGLKTSKKKGSCPTIFLNLYNNKSASKLKFNELKCSTCVAKL